ncbi:MAG TPA: hypothetical protein VK395_07090 [Gemmataceae bacterium]|nr:hypothetical protein [Gemmataceae bacterium]
MMKLSFLRGLPTATCSLTAPAVFGDEGMWLFNNPSRKHLQGKYKVDATDEWLGAT